MVRAIGHIVALSCDALFREEFPVTMHLTIDY